MIKITFKPLIDISHYAGKLTEKLVKMQLSNIGFRLNAKGDSYTITYNEYIVNGEPITTEVVKYDENGLPLLDSDGNPVKETIINDNISFLRTVTETVSKDDFDTISDIVKANLPSGMGQTDINNAILENGIKLFIVQNGFYKGKLKSLNDFE